MNHHKYKTKKNTHIKKKNTLKGGKSYASSCLNKPDVSKYMSSCYTANLHNTNPEADYTLINNSTHNLKGGSSCTNSQPQQNPLTFVDYLKHTNNYISGGNGNTSNFNTTSLEHEIANKTSQAGGSGFSINPEEMIGGLPGRAKYDSCCQPALIDGKLTQGKNTESLCGHQMGGKSKTSKKSKKGKKSKTSKKSKKGKKTKTSKKSKKGKKLNYLKLKKHKGGNVSNYPFTGNKSNFDHSAKDKDFSAKQPYWNVNAR